MLLSSVVQQEVENLGYVTKYDSSTWAPSSIPSIIKNEKYKDDYCWVTPLQLDPITRRRLDNMGEEYPCQKGCKSAG